MVYNYPLSLDKFWNTIYVPKVDGLGYYCPYVAGKLYSLRIPKDSKNYFKTPALIGILKEGFDGVWIIEKCTEKCAPVHCFLGMNLAI